MERAPNGPEGNGRWFPSVWGAMKRRPAEKAARGGAAGRRPPKRAPEKRQTDQKKQRQQRAPSSEDTSIAETTSLTSKVVKVTAGQRAKWQSLSKNTREQLQSMMHWLTMLVKRFKTLKVPVEKLSSLKDVHKVLAEEKEKSVSLEKCLAKLQEEIKNVLSTVELHDGNIQCLQTKIRKLKGQMAAEKATANELFQTNSSDDLDLPGVAQYQDTAPILQDELLKARNQEGILNDLNTVQESEEVKTLFAFLEQAYDCVDA